MGPDKKTRPAGNGTERMTIRDTVNRELQSCVAELSESGSNISLNSVELCVFGKYVYARLDSYSRYKNIQSVKKNHN